MRPASSFLAVFTCAALLLFSLPGCDTTIGSVENAGEPIEAAAANPGSWEFVRPEGARCRNGSQAGFGVRFSESDPLAGVREADPETPGSLGAEGLLIYLEAGGACFSGETCGSGDDIDENLAGFNLFDFNALSGSGELERGILNTSRSENPTRDFAHVYVPYCTGDVHAGSATDAEVPDVEETQQFVGHDNIGLFLDRLRSYYTDRSGPETVLLAGASAGGFGTLANFEQVAEAFPEARLRLLDDSGPVVADSEVLPADLEERWASLWNLPETFAGVSSGGEIDLTGVYSQLSQNYPEARFGLSSFTEDGTIRTFFSGLGDEAIAPSSSAFRRSLLSLQRQLGSFTDQGNTSWSFYYVAGSEHTMIRNGRFFDSRRTLSSRDDYSGNDPRGRLPEETPASFTGRLLADPN